MVDSVARRQQTIAEHLLTKEAKMEMLKKLKFVQYKPNTTNNPQLDRRRKLLDKIDEQIMLAQNRDFKATRLKLTTDASGNRV